MSKAAAFLRYHLARRTAAVDWHGVVAAAFLPLLTIAIAAPFPNQVLCAESPDLRFGWRFHRGDVAGAQAPDFDDSLWRVVRVPHDWAIEGPVDPHEYGTSGKLPWRGVGWYRKSFTLDRPPGERVYLDFDGAMACPQIYVNGKLAGAWDYGYTAFRVDATPYINRNGTNVVAVRLDTTNHVTRWYPGAGLYRKVMLNFEKPTHIAQWGVHVTTPKVTNAEAEIQIHVSIENHQETAVPAEIEFSITAPGSQGFEASYKQTLALSPGTNEVHETIHVKVPLMWDIASPLLYTLRTTLRSDGSVVDLEQTPFGIRTFQFRAEDGFHLNGRRVQLYGVNLHHDLGPLGAAFNVRAAERQLEIMRDMGANAIRTSHNPPAAELLDLCDRMGILVWDECFDKWDGTADRANGTPSHKEHAERHLRSMVMRDRNHPSVVVWSIGNEIASDADGVTPERIQMMCDVVRRYDATRPVGLGCHIPHHSAMFEALDLTGWNYDRRYLHYRELYPKKPIIYSESASALSTRGFYELPLPKTKTDYSSQYQVSSYDLNAAPWSDIADAEFHLMQQDRFVAGEFVWTGFDYLGEPTPFEQQARSSYFGIVDLCGIPKDRYYLYRSHWRPETTTVHILPHWNWRDRVGKEVPVFVYTNGDSAELFVNGRSLGMRQREAKVSRPANFANAQAASASSAAPEHPADKAVDDSRDTRWRPAENESTPWWQVDFEAAQPLKCIIIEFEREAKHYGYLIQTSLDGARWKELLVQEPSDTPRWGGVRTAVHDVEAEARFMRVSFTKLPSGDGAGVNEIAAFAENAEAEYYEPTYAYRLRWNDVIYEPGELKAVAYKDGEPIGTAVVRTAGNPVALRLTPDRKTLAATGDDLGFVLVEAVDENGTTCPLADNRIHFKLLGPGEITAVGNGNPLCMEPFQTDHCQLFFGKAMLIVRTLNGQPGKLEVLATSDKFANGHASWEVAMPANP